MVSIGMRLREERDRLDMNQDDFAALGALTKRALSRYEKDERSPDAAFLAAIAAAGADVLYVVTGVHAGGVKPAPTLTAEEEAMLACWRAAPAAVRRAAMAALVSAGSAPLSMKMSHAGAGAVQVGQVGGSVAIGRPPSPRKRK